MSKTDSCYQNQAIKAAKELHYGADVINKLKKANTDGEIERIMIGARKDMDYD